MQLLRQQTVVPPASGAPFCPNCCRRRCRSLCLSSRLSCNDAGVESSQPRVQASDSAHAPSGIRRSTGYSREKCSSEMCTESDLQAWLTAGRLGKVMDFLEKAQIAASRKFYAQFMSKCGKKKDLSEARRMHAYLAGIGLELDCYLGSGLVEMYVKCGSLEDARKIHKRLPMRNEFSWTALISGHVNLGEGREALRMYDEMREEGVKASRYTFIHVAKACSSLRDLKSGEKMHAHVIESGNASDVPLSNILIEMYVKCGSIVDAQRVFDALPHRDVASWNAIILGCAKSEEGETALELYAQMQKEGCIPNDRTFIGLLKACSSVAVVETDVDGTFLKVGCLERGRFIHSHIVENGFESDAFVGNTLIDMYVNCGSVMDARQVFDMLSHPDVVSWNAMILGYAQKEEGDVALRLYAQMQQEGPAPNDRTFVGVLKACSRLATLEGRKEVDAKFLKSQCLEKGRSIHSQVLQKGFESDSFVGNMLIDMYAKCGSMMDALRVFYKLPRRDIVSWNAMILGCAKKEEGEDALKLYARMKQEGVAPDERTFVGALKACSSLATLEEGAAVDGNWAKTRCLEKGRAIHYQVVKSGFDSNTFVGNMLIDMYVKCGSMVDAQHILDRLPNRDVVSWNAMILGYAEKQEGELALRLYAQMLQEGVTPNDRTFVGALKACSSLATLEDGAEVDGIFVKGMCLQKGRAIHSIVAKGRFESDSYVGTALVDMYSKCGSMVDMQLVFSNLTHADVVSWTAMIRGYVVHGENEEAFKLYARMQEQGVSANSVTFLSILKACGNTAALETGKEIHAQIRTAGLETADIAVGNALIDMYGKCGSMVDAQRVFDEMPSRSLVSWSSLIAGYARQGEGGRDLAFDLFQRMQHEGIQPNGITFLSVLSLCSHAGLVDRGREYFNLMMKDYGITPALEHYSCMVDLLSRAGKMDEAWAMVENMPFQPDLVTWTTLLGACRKWKHVGVARRAFEHAVTLDKHNSTAYVLMSNIYADAHMWEDRDRIQEMKKNAQAWKKPGESWWTDTRGSVHTFTIGDTKHPQSKDIYAKLKDLSIKMKRVGYVPDLDCVLWDIFDDEKEDVLCGHSERLAIGCALINTPPGVTIRVVKNLRVCGDCHKATALISKLEGREIICRDASRFHVYKDGRCSCGDYW